MQIINCEADFVIKMYLWMLRFNFWDCSGYKNTIALEWMIRATAIYMVSFASREFLLKTYFSILGSSIEKTIMKFLMIYDRK